MYKHALSVVSKAAYKTLKRGASSFVGSPPQVSPSLQTRLTRVLSGVGSLQGLLNLPICRGFNPA